MKVTASCHFDRVTLLSTTLMLLSRGISHLSGLGAMAKFESQLLRTSSMAWTTMDVAYLANAATSLIASQFQCTTVVTQDGTPLSHYPMSWGVAGLMCVRICHLLQPLMGDRAGLFTEFIYRMAPLSHSLVLFQSHSGRRYVAPYVLASVSHALGSPWVKIPGCSLLHHTLGLATSSFFLLGCASHLRDHLKAPIGKRES